MKIHEILKENQHAHCKPIMHLEDQPAHCSPIMHPEEDHRHPMHWEEFEPGVQVYRMNCASVVGISRSTTLFSSLLSHSAYYVWFLFLNCVLLFDAIVVFSGNPLMLKGSGFLWDHNHIVTNWHVIRNDSYCRFVHFLSFHFLVYQFSLFLVFCSLCYCCKNGILFCAITKVVEGGQSSVCNIYFLIVRGAIYEQGHFF